MRPQKYFDIVNISSRSEAFKRVTTISSHLNMDNQTYEEDLIEIESALKAEFEEDESIETKHPSHELRPFSCSQCASRFKRKDHLKNHERTHTGEKSYQCSQCEKRFKQKSHQRIHEKRHNNEKTLGCSQKYQSSEGKNL